MCTKSAREPSKFQVCSKQSMRTNHGKTLGKMIRANFFRNWSETKLGICLSKHGDHVESLYVQAFLQAAGRLHAAFTNDHGRRPMCPSPGTCCSRQSHGNGCNPLQNPWSHQKLRSACGMKYSSNTETKSMCFQIVVVILEHVGHNINDGWAYHLNTPPWPTCQGYPMDVARQRPSSKQQKRCSCRQCRVPSCGR